MNAGKNSELSTTEAVQLAGVETRSFYNLAKRYEKENGLKRRRYHNINIE